MACTCTCTCAARARWADLPLYLLGGVIARLPFPGDRARFAAVCRAWRSGVRQHASHLPWIVFPNSTFCTAGHGAACFSFAGLPDDVTCLGAAHDCWLALDCTDDVVRRTTYADRWCRKTGAHLVYSRRNVKHKHTYLLHNPFSNVTVPLPELDAAIGHVAETFHVRKVLMRSPVPDDVIAVTTNNCYYNIILCRPGKGWFVLDKLFRVVDVAFLGDTLYGITSGEELLAFHLSEDEDVGCQITSIELVIKNPLARYYHDKEFPWTWPQDVVDTSDKGARHDDHDNDGRGVSNSNEENEDDDVEDPNQENDNDAEEEYQEEEEEDRNKGEEEEDRNKDQESDDDEPSSMEDYIFNGDGEVLENVEHEGFDEEVSYEPKDPIFIYRYLVKSQSGELLLVRHRYRIPSSRPGYRYTQNVEVLKADLINGKWGASNGLAKGEALFLSQSYSKCIQARGDIQKGFVYYTPHLAEDDAYDMTGCSTRKVAFGWPYGNVY